MRTAAATSAQKVFVKICIIFFIPIKRNRNSSNIIYRGASSFLSNEPISKNGDASISPASIISAIR